MDISLDQAAAILGKTPNEVLFIVQDGRLEATTVADPEIKYLEDGRIEFVGERADPEFTFKFDDVIEFKKKLDEGLDGEIRQILEG